MQKLVNESGWVYGYKSAAGYVFRFLANPGGTAYSLVVKFEGNASADEARSYIAVIDRQVSLDGVTYLRYWNEAKTRATAELLAGDDSIPVWVVDDHTYIRVR